MDPTEARHQTVQRHSSTMRLHTFHGVGSKGGHQHRRTCVRNNNRIPIDWPRNEGWGSQWIRSRSGVGELFVFVVQAVRAQRPCTHSYKIGSCEPCVEYDLLHLMYDIEECTFEFLVRATICSKATKHSKFLHLRQLCRG